MESRGGTLIGGNGEEKELDIATSAFADGDLEFRHDDGEMVICGTPRGLAKLAELCLRLATSGARASEHLHVEDYQVLTPGSLRGTIVLVFRP